MRDLIPTYPDLMDDNVPVFRSGQRITLLCRNKKPGKQEKQESHAEKDRETVVDDPAHQSDIQVFHQ